MDKLFDFAVIGAGPGGYAAAIRAAELGLKTVCIDKDPAPGGTCLHVGCIPSKALLQSTELLARVRKEGPGLGIEAEMLSCNFSQMMQRKKETIQGLEKGILDSFKNSGVRFLQGKAQCIDSKHIRIGSNEEVLEIEAKYILLATGSHPIELPGLRFDERQILSSTGALRLSAIPKRFIVIGAGAIGLELGSVYGRLGSSVTVIEMLDRICPGMDRTVSQELLAALKKQGMRFMLSTKVVSSVVQPDEVILTVNRGDALENVSGDAVLVSVGRKPSSQSLFLEKAGVQIDERGFVVVDSGFQTSQPNIFAVGDLIDGPGLAHRASAEGIAVAETLCGKKAHPVDYTAIPNVIYTSPEAGSVGFTEEEAKAAGLSISIGISRFKANPRARCSAETEGFVKVIAEAGERRVIGMHIVGAHASELIQEGMTAILKRADLHDLAYAPHAHPTLSEAIQEAAIAAVKSSKTQK